MYIIWMVLLFECPVFGSALYNANVLTQKHCKLNKFFIKTAKNVISFGVPKGVNMGACPLDFKKYVFEVFLGFQVSF
jgi:hypothetical protein